MATRAVHLELVSDLSTMQFFHAFMRFTSRRFYPTSILSDNGATFLAAREVIAKIAPIGTVHGLSKQALSLSKATGDATSRPLVFPAPLTAHSPTKGNPPPPLSVTLDHSRPIRATRGRAPQRFTPPPPGERPLRRRVHTRPASQPLADPSVLLDASVPPDGIAAAAQRARTKKGKRSLSHNQGSLSPDPRRSSAITQQMGRLSGNVPRPSYRRTKKSDQRTPVRQHLAAQAARKHGPEDAHASIAFRRFLTVNGV